MDVQWDVGFPLLGNAYANMNFWLGNCSFNLYFVALLVENLKNYDLFKLREFQEIFV